MFVALEPLLKSCGTLKLVIKMKGDDMVVFVMPEGEAKDTALRQPLVMTANAAALDAEFAQHLATYAGAHASLTEQVAATTAILVQAEKTQVSKATKALSGKASRSLPAPGKSSPTEGEPVDDEDSESSDSETSAANDATSTADTAALATSSGTDLTSLF